MFLNSLHIYTVHLRPGQQAGDDMPIFVREGFNIWAFLFTLLWSLYHRLWMLSGLMLGYNLLVMSLQHSSLITSMSASVLMLGMQVIIGFHGNDWVRSKLRRRGFITAGIVTGESLIRAEQRFFEQYLSGETRSAPAAT